MLDRLRAEAGKLAAEGPVQAPSPADFQKQKDQVREQVVQQKRNQLLELFVANLRDQMEKTGKIQINQQVLKQLTSPRNEAS